MQKKSISFTNFRGHNKPELDLKDLSLRGKYGFSQIGISKPRVSYHFINYILARLHKRDENFIAVIQGPTGSGKSYSSISMAMSIDQYFPVQRIVFDVKGFVDVVRSEPPRGSAIVFEEAGVGLHNLNFWSEGNKGANKILQTFRDQNLALILNTPDSQFIDSQTLRLMHCEMFTAGINRKKGYCRLNFNFIRPNYYNKKQIYRNPLRIFNKKLRLWEECNELDVYKPPESMIIAYKKKKLEYKRNLNKGISESLAHKQF